MNSFYNGFTVVAWRKTVVASDAVNFVNLRGKYGVQNDVVDILELSSQQLISKYESFESGIDNRTYSLFLLVCGEHPYYKIKYRDLPKNEIEKLKHGDYMKPFIIKQDHKIGDQVKEIRRKLGDSQEEFANLFGDCTKGDISKIENNKKTISDRAWTLLLLATNQHPHYFLLPNIEGEEVIGEVSQCEEKDEDRV